VEVLPVPLPRIFSWQAPLTLGLVKSERMGPNEPLVNISSWYLAGGVRFSFLQPYFGLLYSNLRDSSVARIVACPTGEPDNPTAINPDGHFSAITTIQPVRTPWRSPQINGNL